MKNSRPWVQNRFLAHYGVTLIELLITTVILSFMGLAVYSSFASGISVWKRGKESNITEREARLTLEKMARELRNTFHYVRIPFRGTEDSVTFPGYIQVKQPGGDPAWEVGAVKYSFDSSKKNLLKQQLQYPDLFEVFEDDSAYPVLENVENITYRYYLFDDTKKLYEWIETWEEQIGFPLGIQIKVNTKDDKQEQEFTKTVFFPVPLNS